MAKDLYEILMVDRTAELIAIEAVYRRLAREYHPDVNKQPDAHRKMVEINEAYAILKDATTRAEYDRSLGSTTRSTEPGRAPQTERRATPIQRPASPNPRSFGIAPGYYERAVQGALAWKSRKRAMPIPVTLTAGIVLVCIGTEIRHVNVVVEPKWLSSMCAYAWLILPLIGFCLLVQAQNVLDTRLRQEKYDPEYNPNPTGYISYAQELARYENELSEVYLTATGSCFHANSSCGSYQFVKTMPTYEAIQRGYSACSRCGKRQITAKRLPPPFGDGFLPQEV